jgi:hypothetical protein
MALRGPRTPWRDHRKPCSLHTRSFSLEGWRLIDLTLCAPSHPPAGRHLLPAYSSDCFAIDSPEQAMEPGEYFLI